MQQVATETRQPAALVLRCGGNITAPPGAEPETVFGEGGAGRTKSFASYGWLRRCETFFPAQLMFYSASASCTDDHVRELLKERFETTGEHIAALLAHQLGGARGYLPIGGQRVRFYGRHSVALVSYQPTGGSWYADAVPFNQVPCEPGEFIVRRSAFSSATGAMRDQVSP